MIGREDRLLRSADLFRCSARVSLEKSQRRPRQSRVRCDGFIAAENTMSEQDDLPQEALDDPFRPPEPPRLVFCLHCGNTYMSSLMQWDGQFWFCGMPDCNGKGYGIDIFDADDNPFDDAEGDEFDGEYDLDIDIS
jgi:hypothetical protein